MAKLTREEAEEMRKRTKRVIRESVTQTRLTGSCAIFLLHDLFTIIDDFTEPTSEVKDE